MNKVLLYYYYYFYFYYFIHDYPITLSARLGFPETYGYQILPYSLPNDPCGRLANH